MFTKLLNKLGIRTNAQKREDAIIAEKLRRQARSARFGRQAQAVITTDNIPTKSPNKTTSKTPPSAVRRGADTDWQIVGYTNNDSPFSYGAGSSSNSCDSGSSSSSSYDSGSSYSSDSGSSSYSCD